MSPVFSLPTLPRAGVGRGRAGAEVLIVLAISLGQSAIYSVLSIINRLTQPAPLSSQTSSLNASVTPDRPWLDLTYQLAGIAFALVPVVLALYLISLDFRAGTDGRSRPWRAIGFDLRRPVRDLVLGLVVAACIGIPGLGLYLGARALGLNTTVQASGLGEHWWAIPVLLLSAAQNAVLEETIMLGFLYRRFTALGWRLFLVVGVSALIRGSYHLYQGFGGFAGNLIMGAIFGLIYLRTRRVMPLVVAHTTLDIVAFVGYALVAPHVSWL